MVKLKQNILSSPFSFNKLVQLPTIIDSSIDNQSIKENKILGGRCSKKYYSNSIIAPLLYYARQIDSPLVNHYQNAWHCRSILVQKDNHLIGKYCNSRVCHTCNRIRTSRYIDGYLPEVETWKEIAFLTLTIKNVKADDLRSSIASMKREFSNIVRVLTEKRKIDVKCLVKYECTYNTKEKTFHPHIHFLGDSMEIAKIILDEWFIRWIKKGIKDNVSYINMKGQKLKLGDLLTLKELFKYPTKIIDTDWDKKKNKIKTTDAEQIIVNVNLYALDIIMRALFKTKTIIAYGIKKEVKDEVTELLSDVFLSLPDDKGSIILKNYYNPFTKKNEIVKEYEWIEKLEWVWKQNQGNWFNQYDTPLCSYKIPLVKSGLLKGQKKIKFNFYDENDFYFYQAPCDSFIDRTPIPLSQSIPYKKSLFEYIKTDVEF